MFNPIYSFFSDIQVDKRLFPEIDYEFKDDQCCGNCTVCYLLERECPKEKDIQSRRDK